MTQKNISGMTEELISIDHRKIFKFVELIKAVLADIERGYMEKERNRELNFMLDAFATNLETHFKLEESFGELHEVLFQNAEFKEDVDKIFDEHKTFAVEIKKIRDHAGKLFIHDPGRMEKIRKDFIKFTDDLKAHESFETELFNRAFYHLGKTAVA